MAALLQEARALSPLQSPVPEPPPAPPAQPAPVQPAPTEQPTATPAPTITPTDVMSGAVKLFDFERRVNWRRGRPAGGTFARSTEQKYAGAASGKLAYVLPATANNFVVFESRTRLTGQPTGLSAWVFGDGSSHYLNAWVQDGTGQVRQFTFGQITHTGWKQLFAELATDERPWPANSHVSGRDTGKLSLPYTFRGLVLDGVPDNEASRGTIYVDEVFAVYQPVPGPVQTQ
jgi:hypothetical protein